jgi:hypothetical protein
MTIQNYLIIENNIVTNIVVWDGNTNTWQPPPNSIALVQEDIEALIWGWDSEIKDYVLTENMGAGDIGFLWDGLKLTTNQPKPELPTPEIDQPATTGTVTI